MKNLLLITLFIILPNVSHASEVCSCIHHVTPEEAYHEFPAIFSAHVHKYTHPGAVLKIDKVWKGISNKEFLDVRNTTICGYGALNEQKYLLYAYPIKDKNNLELYDIIGCNPSKPLDEARIDLQYLDALVAEKNTELINQSLPRILSDTKEKNKVRLQAAKIIDVVIHKSMGKEIPEGTVEALLKAAKADDPELRGQIVFSLGTYYFRERKDVHDALIQFLNSDNIHIRHAAAASLEDAQISNSNIFNALVLSFNQVQEKGRDGWNLNKTKDYTDPYKNILAKYCLAIAENAKTKENKSKAIDLILSVTKEIEGNRLESDVRKKLKKLQKGM